MQQPKFGLASDHASRRHFEQRLKYQARGCFGEKNCFRIMSAFEIEERSMENNDQNLTGKTRSNPKPG
jgi:hypothetical protein